MLDIGHEAGLHPPSAQGAQPAGRADTAPLAPSAHQADASTPGEAPPRGPPATRAQSEARETTPDTPQRAAGRQASPSRHNRDEDSFDCLHIAVYTRLPAVEWLGLFVARHTAQSLQYLSRMA